MNKAEFDRTLIRYENLIIKKDRIKGQIAELEKELLLIRERILSYSVEEPCDPEEGKPEPQKVDPEEELDLYESPERQEPDLVPTLYTPSVSKFGT